MVVENNFGYSGLPSTMSGGVASPGLQRVDIDGRTARAATRSGAARSAHLRWCRSCRWPAASSTRSPNRRAATAPTPGTSRRSTSAPAKRSTAGWRARASATTTTSPRLPWGPTARTYVGTLGGIVRLADASSPAQLRLRLRLRVRYRRGARGCARGAVRARVRGQDAEAVRVAGFRLGRRLVRRDRSRPFSARIKRSRLRRGRAATPCA